jgi:hypothetical protein
LARVDEAPEDRDQTPLHLAQIVECPLCETEFEHLFTADDGVFELEDLVDQPEEEVQCPACEGLFIAIYEGWTIHGEAG